jgi:hypothetical protein
VRPWLLVLSVLIATPAVAAEPDAFGAWRHQEVKKAAVVSYDALRQEVVLVHDEQLLTLRTGKAEVVGQLVPGCRVDASYESAGFYAHRIEVKPGRARPL